MPKLSALLIAVMLCALSGTAQTTSLAGSVADTSQKKGIANAVVLLLTPVDSVLYKFTRTDSKGNYSFKNIRNGNYILMTTHPYFADFVDNISVNEATSSIPQIAVTSKSKLLQEVIVKSGNPIRVKGDTTIYTADSFKVSANANVEELLKKLPGIQVDKSGKITAMGEQVTKVLVDGEEFFGDDPGMAVKNLRADAVKEVQVFDKKSEQAEFTGIDDGKTQKTINLKMKEDRKKGYFGKIDMAGGFLNNRDDRYNSNILLSSFKGKRKLSAFLLTGNTGQDGLNWEDAEKFGGENENMSMSIDDDGGVMMMWTGGNSSDEEPYVNTQNGFIKNINAGVQYSNKWNDKQTLNLSPKYNSQVYNNSMQRYAQSLYNNDSLLIDQSTTDTYVNRYNFKTSGSYEIKLDSNNTIKFTAKANFYHTESEEDKASTSTGNTGTLKNSSSSNVKLDNDKQALFGSLLYKHKFKKPRRTLSLNTDWNGLTTDGSSFLKSFNQVYFNGLPSSVQNINQQRITDKSTQKVSSRLVYTEPLSAKYSLELAYELSYNYGKNNQVTYTYSPVSQKYDVEVDSLTNNFTQSILINKPSARINYSGKKVKFNFGSGFGFTHFDLVDKSLNKDYIRNYTNFFPSASLNYTYKSQHNLRINYNGSTNQPSLNQLQPLRNNTDYFNQYVGNPDLKPSFTNSFNISHNTYNFLKDMFMYQSFNVRFTSNAITNNRIIDLDSGKTITKPINTNGNYSMNLWTGMGFKVKKINTRFNLGPNFRYSRTADVFNNLTNYSKNLGVGLNMWISKSKDKKYDFGLSNDFSYNSSKTSLSNTSTHYYVNTLSFNATVYFLPSLSISSDYDFYTQQKTSQLNGFSTHILNARLQKTFKKDEFTAYFTVRDILNQNVGLSRNFNSNTFTETRNDRLQRYWMIGFTWNFKNKSAAAK
ncbi:MAG TPA: outer membrane beta-barrel family protein [Ferruginibacter sp.]|nr:outer membrane beta-barrel family protein [Ferruginibacter sp.]